MRILVIGGTGFISSRIVEKLLASGHEVTTFTRGKSIKNIRNHPKLFNEFGDRHDENKMKEIAAKNFDAVYDMIAYEEDESKLMVKVFKEKTGHFIHCSTISVYMISNDVVCPITEDQWQAPMMSYDPRNPFGMDYGINKRKCEEILWDNYDEKKFPVTILRPTFVSGPFDPAKRDFFWIERILDDRPLLVPGSGEFKFQQIYIEDSAEAFFKVLNSSTSIGQAYNVASEDVFTLNEYLEALSNLLDKNPEIVHLDQQTFDTLSISRSSHGDVFPFNTRRDAHFGLKKIKKDLNFSSTPFDDWMSKTINWYLNDYKQHSIGYEKRNEELNILQKKI